MTKKRNKVVRRRELLRLTTGISSSSSTKPISAISEPSSTVLSYVTAAVEPKKELPPQITTSEPSFTSPNSGSSHDRAASEKAFLDSIVLPDPFRPEPTENDLVNNSPWLAAMCPNLFAKYNKGSEKTLTQAFLDAMKAEIARHPPLPPDYDSDAEWDSYGGGCRDESHLANDEEFDWDSFRSTIVHHPPAKI
ncbi:unnamed protein product [Linum tenue]|uniref:Uncharacterized protein n=1 Tax=Linum tenue TaxID=586396 RepID=A0AAV0N769_9ROSI|nr:unnamed protein product [Linum tenue]